mmetsp:Transcript_7330/g.8783  ORF Transcript_7330/g.8783 Transcript_7330/m.8783 type:complete len:155 (+) Transcript_7330:722-1186(+)|eukprot:CAMPEP_0170450902 /NCGR_PEP_ID=MMETSP0123-20130129/297_1 /TAXON_ID=182087 /ORGANISM="Favella ehrenbergii, Strain Fehren 1" /LENGTH=154 /DNA_ID=CAMNT_0010712365 /DNA_START=616 /DNA_END=1080 /DNA_ORIENTATION=-
MKFGRCELDVPKKSAYNVLISQILNPFYIFQIFGVALWTFETYYTYAVVILTISTGSILISLVETIQNHNKIREMALLSCPVKLISPTGAKIAIESTELVPGDIIEVPKGKTLPCDLILLSGSAVVNESMLTGESVPILKNSLPEGSGESFSEE